MPPTLRRFLRIRARRARFQAGVGNGSSEEPRYLWPHGWMIYLGPAYVKQLDSLEAGPDADLYNAVLDACELIFRLPAQAHARSTAIRTPDGIRFRLSVAGHPPPYKVFWSSDGPRIEAVFPHP